MIAAPLHAAAALLRLGARDPIASSSPWAPLLGGAGCSSCVQLMAAAQRWTSAPPQCSTCSAPERARRALAVVWARWCSGSGCISSTCCFRAYSPRSCRREPELPQLRSARDRGASGDVRPGSRIRCSAHLVALAQRRANATSCWLSFRLTAPHVVHRRACQRGPDRARGTYHLGAVRAWSCSDSTQVAEDSQVVTPSGRRRRPWRQCTTVPMFAAHGRCRRYVKASFWSTWWCS